MSRLSMIKQNNDVVQERAFTLEEEVAITLVHALPDSSTITAGQIKELAPVVAKILEQRTGRMLSRANSYDTLANYIKTTFPDTYQKASYECHSNNCQSEPIILITTVKKLTSEIDQDHED